MQVAPRILIALTLLISSQAGAQTSPCKVTTTFDPTTNKMVTTKCDSVVYTAPINGHDNSLGPAKASIIAPVSIDPGIVAARQRVIQAQADYAVWSDDYAKRIFEYQIVYTNVIFVVVNLLVLTGLYFAWLQFRATINAHRAIHRALTHPGQSIAMDDANVVPKENAEDPRGADTLGFQQTN